MLTRIGFPVKPCPLKGMLTIAERKVSSSQPKLITIKYSKAQSDSFSLHTQSRSQLILLRYCHHSGQCFSNTSWAVTLLMLRVSLTLQGDHPHSQSTTPGPGNVMFCYRVVVKHTDHPTGLQLGLKHKFASLVLPGIPQSSWPEEFLWIH